MAPAEGPGAQEGRGQDPVEIAGNAEIAQFHLWPLNRPPRLAPSRHQAAGGANVDTLDKVLAFLGALGSFGVGLMVAAAAEVVIILPPLFVAGAALVIVAVVAAVAASRAERHC